MDLIISMHVPLAILCVLYLGQVNGDNHVARVGNAIKASASGVDAPGATFLIADHVFQDGVLFAFSAFFRTDQPVKFQVWRPTAVSHDFTLITETRVIPSVKLSREDVYIESRLTDKCVRVRAGDRLGIHMETSPGSVSYTFQPLTPTALGNTLSNLSDPHIPGDTASFGALTFPYDFSAAAYVDPHLDDYDLSAGDMVDCRHGLLIPDDFVFEPLLTTTPSASVTGRVGGTGATGPTGARGPAGPGGSMGSMGGFGATGTTGEDGATGPQGEQGIVGDAGVMGPDGGLGATGPRGETGDTGEQGPRGLPGPPGDFQPPKAAALTGIGTLSTPYIVLVLLVWLGLVTVSMLLLLIFLCRLLRRREDAFKRRRLPSESTETSRPSSHWHDTMKDVSSKDLYNETIPASFPDLTLKFVDEEMNSSSTAFYSTSTATRHNNEYSNRHSGKQNPNYTSDQEQDEEDIYPTMTKSKPDIMYN